MTQRQDNARKENIKHAQDKWRNMSQSARDKAREGLPSEAQKEAARENVQKAQEKWHEMSHEERIRARAS